MVDTRLSSPPSVETKLLPDETSTIPMSSFSTSEFDQAERYDAWRAFLSPVTDIRRPKVIDETFGGHINMWDFKLFALCQYASSDVGFVSNAKRLRRGGPDHWNLVYMKSGQKHRTIEGGVQAGSSMIQSAGQLALYSLTNPGSGRLGSGEHISIFLPRNLFLGESQSLDRLSDSVIQSTFGQLLVDYLEALLRNLRHLCLSDRDTAASATLAAVRACLVPTADSLVESEKVIQISLRERVRKLVRMNLLDPGLNASWVAANAGVSRSVLYRAFESQGGVLKYIRTLRLNFAAHMLCDRSDTRQIKQIGFACGFRTQQEFSRAFKEHFGCTPFELQDSRDGIDLPLLLQGPAGNDSKGRSWQEFLEQTA